MVHLCVRDEVVTPSEHASPWHHVLVKLEPQQTRLKCYGKVFLFTPPAPESLTILGHRLSEDARPCLQFIMSHVDYCNAVLAGSPQYITDTHRRVLNTAARLVSGTHKFDEGLSRLLQDEPHWLNVPEQVQYKLAVTVHRCCLQDEAPKYLVDHCIPVSDVTSQQHLRSAS